MPTPRVTANPVQTFKAAIDTAQLKAISPKAPAKQDAVRIGKDDAFASHQTHRHGVHTTHAHREPAHSHAKRPSHDTTHLHHAHGKEPVSQSKGSMQDFLNTPGGFGGPVAQPVWFDELDQAIGKVKDNWGHSLEHFDQKGGGGRPGGVIGDYSGGGWGW